MVNEDIITSLRNSINSGESLQESIQIMINSGYDPREVYKAARYINQGATPELQIYPDEHLTMPGPSLPKQPSSKHQQTNPLLTQHYPLNNQASQPQEPFKQQISQRQQTLQINQPTQPQEHMQQVQNPQNTQNINQPIPQSPLESPQQQDFPLRFEKPKQPKKSYLKEIILFFILLILITLLVMTILFKDKILGLIS